MSDFVFSKSKRRWVVGSRCVAVLLAAACGEALWLSAAPGGVELPQADGETAGVKSTTGAAALASAAPELWVGEELFQAVLQDLEISGCAREPAEAAYALYVATMQRTCEEVVRSFDRDIHAVRRQVMPELDPAVDLETLPDRRRRLVREARAREAAGEDPIGSGHAAYMRQFNELATRFKETVLVAALATRDQLVDTIAGSCQNCDPSMLRARITAAAFAGSATQVSYDVALGEPMLHLDLLTGVRDAMADAGVLQEATQVVWCLGPVCGERPATEWAQSMRNALLAYEIESAGLIDELCRRNARIGRDIRGAESAAERAAVFDARTQISRRLHRARWRLIDAVSECMSKASGDLVASDWRDQARARMFPRVHRPPVCAVAGAWLLNRLASDDPRLADINLIVDSASTVDAHLLPQLCQAMIEESSASVAGAKWFTDPTGSATVKLEGQRRRSSDDAVAGLRRVLSKEELEEFNVVVERLRKEHDQRSTQAGL